MDSEVAQVLVDGERFRATAARPFIFGRRRADGIVGLDPGDMGISARAGAIELAWGSWWLVNLSTKRPLLLAFRPGAGEVTVAPGDRHALTTARPTVLVPGAVYTHVLAITLPAAYAQGLHESLARSTSGTMPIDEPELSEKDRLVLTAVCRGYLESFPRRDEAPRTYGDVARALGSPWTAVRVRKQVERVKARFAGAGHHFTGPRANHELATHLLLSGALTPADLHRVPAGAGTR